MGSTVRPERFSKACISSSSAPRRRTEVGARLRDVRVSEPPLNGREGHASVHPARAAFPSQIMEVQTVDLRSPHRNLPDVLDRLSAPSDFIAEDKTISRRGVPAGSRRRRSRISRKTLDMGTRRSRLVFVFDAARKISARGENRIVLPGLVTPMASSLACHSNGPARV
jgi:hypothetical protein